MKKNDFILVYGTLRSGERASLSASQHQFDVTLIGEDYINGCMYNLGSYPGLKAEAGVFDPGQPSIVGEVFLVRNESISALLDAYEGYPYLYNRIETMTASGKKVWVYTYNHDVSLDQLIDSGDWKTRIQETQAVIRAVA